MFVCYFIGIFLVDWIPIKATSVVFFIAWMTATIAVALKEKLS